MKKILCLIIVLFTTTITFAQKETIKTSSIPVETEAGFFTSKKMGYIVDTRGDTIVGFVKLRTDTIDFQYMKPQYGVSVAKRNFAYSDIVDYGYYRTNDFDDLYKSMVQLPNQTNQNGFYVSAKSTDIPPVGEMPVPCDLILDSGDTLQIIFL